MAQSQTIRTFVLGSKELDGKTAEFQYDCGLYSIFDLVGEERRLVYKSKNAQEAYMKWNVYIGRKKERQARPAFADEVRQNTPITETAAKATESQEQEAESQENKTTRAFRVYKKTRNEHTNGVQQHGKNEKNRPDKLSNRPNRTRRESVRNVAGEEAVRMEENTEAAGSRYRRDRGHRRRHYPRESSKA